MQRRHHIFIITSFLFGCLIVLASWLLVQHLSNTRTMVDSFNSTCIVRTGISQNGLQMGTGFLLDTGYVVSAAHVVDLNSNGQLEDNEKYVTCTFGEIEYLGRVATFNNRHDFVVIEGYFPIPTKPGLHLAAGDVTIAERIYTIGATEGRPLMITEGIVGHPEEGRGRASCFISSGNSGGALFNDRHEAVGIVVRMGTRFQGGTARIPVPYQGHVVMAEGMTFSRVPMHAMCSYTKLVDIREALLQSNLSSLVDNQKGPTLYGRIVEPWTFGIIRTVIHLLIVLSTLYFFRKHI